VAALFAAAGVPCRVSTTIEIDLWTKMIMNCAGNAITAVAQTSFGHVAQSLPVRTVLQKVIAETVSIARASGVPLPDEDWAEKGRKNAENLGEATSSMAQDIARGKRTEIDSLNGYIVRRGAELGIQTPVSDTLTALVKLIEETNAKRGRTAGTSR
jgi:2-dehydropantoate 2-reductase